MGKYIKLYPECLERKKKKNSSLTDPSNEHEYVEIGGIKWATMNIGAKSVTDTGLYFQWGDTQGYTAEQAGSGEGKKYFSGSDYKWYNGSSSDVIKYTNTDGLNTIEPSDDAATAAWGETWRMPTKDELQILLNSTTSVWTDDYENSGVAGLVLTSNTDSNKKLFLPTAGYITYGSVNYISNTVKYLSSTRYSNNYNYVLNAYSNGNKIVSSEDRYYGLPIRPVYDPSIKPVGKVQVFANPECTEYADGQSDEVWVRVNQDFGFGDEASWGNISTLGSCCTIATPSSSVSTDPYEIALWMDFNSYDRDNTKPFVGGEIIKCSHSNPSLFVPIDNPQVIFE